MALRVVDSYGREDIAMVYVARTTDGLVEFVESIQPPLSRDEKWVNIISTLYGCPVGCVMCDAGRMPYSGRVSKEDMLAQIDYLISRRYPDGIVRSRKYKIQFARMGEPSLNMAVIDVLYDLPERYNARGLIPSISTVAPIGTEEFFNRLIEVKNTLYANGMFQLQFSIHSTDERQRDAIIPVRKWTLAEIASFGRRWYREGDRKITLNFALARGNELSAEKLAAIFDPEIFLVKITPVNPTTSALENGLEDAVLGGNISTSVDALRDNGFEVIVSIGEIEENLIGSNCGQYVNTYLLRGKDMTMDAYTYTRVH